MFEGLGLVVSLKVWVWVLGLFEGWGCWGLGSGFGFVSLDADIRNREEQY